MLKSESKKDHLTDAAVEYINHSENHDFSFRSKNCSFKLCLFSIHVFFYMNEK